MLLGDPIEVPSLWFIKPYCKGKGGGVDFKVHMCLKAKFLCAISCVTWYGENKNKKYVSLEQARDVFEIVFYEAFESIDMRIWFIKSEWKVDELWYDDIVIECLKVMWHIDY